jgi:hypothetical protein
LTNEEEIAQQEKDMSEFQEKKFGPKGELITQKAVLVKPIQDQVFTIVQEISATRKLDLFLTVRLTLLCCLLLKNTT